MVLESAPALPAAWTVIAGDSRDIHGEFRAISSSSTVASTLLPGGSGSTSADVPTAETTLAALPELAKGVSAASSDIAPASRSRGVAAAGAVSESFTRDGQDVALNDGAEKGVVLFSVDDAVAGEARDLIELPTEQTSNSEISLQFIVHQSIGGNTNSDFDVILRDRDDASGVSVQVSRASAHQPYVIAARQYIVLGGNGHDFSPDLQWHAARVLPASAVTASCSPRAAEWSADLARRWLALAERASIHHGDLRITAPEQLPAGVLLVVGDVEMSVTGQLQCSILATGRIRVRCRHAFFKPLVDNVLFLSESGIDIRGDDNGFRGDMAALDSRVRIQGRRQRFASGSLWGRHVLIRGENHAFISD